MALASPFGTFRPPNISPNPVDGICRWSAADLATALIGGVSPRRNHYYPSFFTGMTVADVNDVYAYLMTLPRSLGARRRMIQHYCSEFAGSWDLGSSGGPVGCE
ncbi:hypothetical protein [Mesorhizobium caraganae]|uniref:hypothetical protein n=1 Tax=Mesorhizobium caraganae TaxID=483206 RepID=UPI003F4FCE84